MEWIALVLAIFGVIYCANHYPQFRRVLRKAGLGALALVGAAIALVVYFYFHEQRERQIAGSLVTSNQVEVANATLTLSGYGSGDLNAIVENRSPHLLTHLEILVSVTDCPNSVALTPMSNCAVV